MNILSIETSCDETAVSVVEALGDFPHAKYEILGNALHSQIELHREYGGVFPSLAKREHALTLIPMLEKALTDTKLPQTEHHTLFPEQIEKLHEILYREEGLADNLLSFYERYNTPAIGLIAVTAGPGLEPALWVGVNFAKALSYLWNVPVVGVNHMEGHVLASVFDGRLPVPGEERQTGELPAVVFPALSLLISGGHTELVLMKDWLTYELVGQTRDDAVGEAFDKAARMMGLPYPGGPEISRLARSAREANLPQYAKLPHPMIDSGDADFSFSGLKTAVRYAIADKTLTDDERCALARDFEDAVTEVLLSKTKNALDETGARSLILGGGVTANTHIRKKFEQHLESEYPDVHLYLPDPKLSTDNSVMIALAGHAHTRDAMLPQEASNTIKADGNRSLTEQ